SLQKAHYAQRAITALPGFSAAWERPFFHEFVVRTSADPEELVQRLLDYQIIGGLPLGRFYPELSDAILFCVTEARTKEEIDRLVDALEGLTWPGPSAAITWGAACRSFSNRGHRAGTGIACRSWT